jgi:predicted kinase
MAGLGENAMKQTLNFIILCGPSHSGKSTYAEKLLNTFNDTHISQLPTGGVIINTDTIRESLHGSRKILGDEREVWKTFQEQKMQALGQEKNIIIDACNLS